MTIVNDILKQMAAVSQPQRKFLTTLFATILALRGRVTFRNLSRYCDYSERTIARQFRAAFAWPDFHQRVLTAALDPHSELISVQDASFIPKSGKQTFGLGHFFNGCAGRAERGLEISTLAVVAVTRRCAFTLAVTQTPPGDDTVATAQEKEETRIDFYKRQLREQRHRLPHSVNFHDLHRFEELGQLEDAPQVHLYTAMVWHVSLKRKLRVVILVNRKAPTKPRYIVLASTDLELDGRKLVELYAARFQIEFLFRDSKQFTGLADCQARAEVTLDFHFNASLATLNLARAEELLASPAQSPQVFSMASWKQRRFNERLLDLFSEKLALEPTWVKNQPCYGELRTYGAIAA